MQIVNAKIKVWLSEIYSEDRKISKCLMYFLPKTLRKRGFLSITTFQFCFQNLSNYKVQENQARGVGAQLTKHISFTLHLFLLGKSELNYASSELRGVFKDIPRLRWDRTSQQALFSLEMVS